MAPLYHRYHILNKQRSQNVRTQLWDSDLWEELLARYIGRNETLDLVRALHTFSFQNEEESSLVAHKHKLTEFSEAEVRRERITE